MEKHRFVFESFEDFLKNSDSLLEAKEDSGTELKIDGATELVDRIISLDLDLAENALKKSDASKDSATKVYGMKAIEALRKKEYGKGALYVLLGQTSSVSPTEIDAMNAIGLDIDSKTKSPDKRAKVKSLGTKFESMSEDEAKKLAEAGLKAYKEKLPYKFRTPLLWGMLSDADKGKVYDDFFKLAIKRGYDTKEGLEKVIQDHFRSRKKGDASAMVSPGVMVFLTREEITQDAPPAKVTPEKTFLLDDEKSSDVFKPNKTGANGQADFMEASFDELVGKLGSIFERYKAGEITTIKKINILTSADRYRNTEDAEKLSWGELSYSRAIAMTKLVEGVAKAAGLDDDIISQLPKVTSIYAKGGNGDGTSGPNPPEGKKFGYYVKSGDASQWTDGTDRSIVTLIPIDEEGTPTSENADGAKTKKEAPEANVKDYNKFRYNNIEIEFEKVEIVPGKEEPLDSDKIVALKYPVKIKIPSRYSTTTIKIPIPSITTSSSSSGKSSKPGSCPSFKETTKLKLGLTHKTINILTYKSDLTKKLF
jgi:hypothetical protein